MSLPSISPISPITSIVPLVFVLATTAAKEWCGEEVGGDYVVHNVNRRIEDRIRGRSDRTVNGWQTLVLRDGIFQALPWSDVRVGDIVHIRKNEGFPVDIAILSTTEPQGLCYVETANLDGETNLKIHQALPQTAFLNSCEAVANLVGRAGLEYEKPNNRLYNFTGNLLLDGKKYPLGVNQVLLRGCVLRNTESVVGVALFTGHETKLFMNSSDPPSKQSQMEKKMNQFILLIFALMFSLAAIAALSHASWASADGALAWYLDFGEEKSAQRTFKDFITFSILMNIMVPISLYVSLELVKVVQSRFMNWDLEMYYPVNDTPARARTSNLGEELGQVRYIFSDKTGTLTCNQMDFMKCSVAGKTYGRGLTEIGIAALRRQGTIVPPSEPAPDAIPGYNFDDPLLLERLYEKHEDAGVIREFLEVLAVCHTVIAEEDDDGELLYQASSPDEGALVTAAKCLGFEFIARGPDHVTITLKKTGEKRKYELLQTLEFNSTRKRMSIIVRTPEGEIKVFCKGADTVVRERLAKGDPRNEIETVTVEHLEAFAADGLRTLCLAVRTMSEEDYQEWNKIYYEAARSLEDRDEKVDAAAALVEQEFILLGATAIEDKLQRGVPDCISTLAAAGIKLWVLTGDKRETAINIGFACQLLTMEMKLVILEGASEDAVRLSIQKAVGMYKEQGDKKVPLAVIIDGQALSFALYPSLKQLFLELCMQCKSVVCCRVSPLQKAEVVLLVKNALKEVTLAIGDGANDVSMIQSAHIGVGISGQEGLQAVMASDYAIAQFRFLQRLLLVHGRWAYLRIAKLMMYSFGKNFAFALTHFLFGVYSGFSGTSIHNDFFIAVYNLFFTGLPIMVTAAMDRDIDAHRAEQYPQVYEDSQSGLSFNLLRFGLWLLEAVYHSFVVFFAVYFSMPYMAVFSNGQVGGMDSFSITMSAVLFMVVTARVCVTTSTWTKINWFGIILSFVLFWLLHFLLGVFIGDMTFLVMALNPRFLLVQVLASVFAMIPVIAGSVVKRTYWPRLSDRIRDADKLHPGKLSNASYEDQQVMRKNATQLKEKEPVLPDPEEPKITPLNRFRKAGRLVMRAQLWSSTSGASSYHTGYAFASDPGWANVANGGVPGRRLLGKEPAFGDMPDLKHPQVFY